MDLSDALRCLVRGSHDRGAAMDVVLGVLREEMGVIARKWSVPAADGQDVLGDVLLRLLESFPLPVVGEGKVVIRAYLRRMLENRWRMKQRTERRLQATHLASASGEEGSQPPPSTPVDCDLAAARRELERAYQHVLSNRSERFKPALEATWSQFCALTFEEGTIDSLCAKQGADTPETRKHAQQRIHKGLSRLREELLHAVDEMAATGAFTSEQAQLVRGFVAATNNRTAEGRSTATPGAMR